MKRQVSLITLSILVLMTLAGCKVSPERALTEKRTESSTENNSASSEYSDNASETISEGEIWNAKIVNNRPVAVMLDNHAGARPQAGLKQAEIVIEALAEGNITRYMAFFFEGMPESVGPIRSARPYFIDRAMEFDAIYVHVGGSPKALSDVKKMKVADLDGLTSTQKVFYRKSHKKTPHNLYSSLKTLRDESVRHKYSQGSTFISEIFADADIIPEGGVSAEYINLPYRKNDGGYAVSYGYFSDLKVYQRYVNGKVHVDETDGTALTTKNILIQYVPTKVVDNAGRLDLELVGKGEGWWLTDGVKVPILWEKNSRTDYTTYSTTDGTPIALNPGNLWIQIVPKSLVIGWEK